MSGVSAFLARVRRALEPHQARLRARIGVWEQRLLGRLAPDQVERAATLAAAVVGALLIWFLAPAFDLAGVRPFASPELRLVAVLAVMVGWGIANGWRQRRAQAQEQRLISALVSIDRPPPSVGAVERARLELAGLQGRLAAALARLGEGPAPLPAWRRWWQPPRRLGHLPWYLLIGPPGAGKTSALIQAGLSFPLTGEDGGPVLSGLAGTRTCDWWFTDQAVIIDTAGRYATQDSQALVDGTVWSGLLDLLLEHRPARPVDGVVVALSAAELASELPEERLARAQALNFRLRELDCRFGQAVPVYLLVTKLDLVAGFESFFTTLTAEERDQPWGFRLPMSGAGAGEALPGAPGRGFLAFGPAFEDLLRRLESRLPVLLDSLAASDGSGSPARLGAALAFPAQMTQLGELLGDFLSHMLRPAPGGTAPALRGVWLTSALREGVPIDLLAQPAPRPLLEQRIIGEAGPPRGTFLGTLVPRLIVPDALPTDPAQAQAPEPEQRRHQRRLSLILGAAAAGLMVLAWAGAWIGNRVLLGEVAEGVAAAEQQLQPLTQAPHSLARVDQPDLAAVLPLLDTVRTLRDHTAQGGPPLLLDFGLWQGERLSRAVHATYRRALGNLLLPRLLLALEQRLAADDQRPEVLYGTLATYLMLGGQGPLDRFQVTEAFALDWLGRFPGPQGERQRRHLEEHLAALIEGALRPVPLNDGLIAYARRRLASFSLAERGYRLVRQDPTVEALAPWRPQEQAGAALGRWLVRRSGAAVEQPLPGLVTRAGVVRTLPVIERVAQQLARESWVLGLAGDDLSAAENARRLGRDLQGRYAEDLRRRWQGLADDLTVAPLADLPQAVAALAELAGPQSPWRLLVTAAGRESSAALAALAAATGAPEGAPAAQSPFAPALQAPFGQTPPLERLQAALDGLYGTLAPLAAARVEPPVPGQVEAVRRLEGLARELPPPLARWVGELAERLRALALGDLRRQAAAAWAATVQPLCQGVLEGRYPLEPAGRLAAEPAALSRLLAPGGELDNFFNLRLARAVDRSRRPWSWRPGAEGGFERGPFGDEALQWFQRTAELRRLLFAEGEDWPTLGLELTLVALDARVEQVVLELDGQRWLFGPGARHTVHLNWSPGGRPPGRSGAAALRLLPAVKGRPADLVADGPWGLWRLIDQGRGPQTPGTAAEPALSGGRQRLVFVAGERRAVFELVPGLPAEEPALGWPAARQLLNGLHCPALR